MHKSGRTFALLLCILLLLTAVVSSAYIAENAGHDCIGHGCEVCARIAGAAVLLGGMAVCTVQTQTLRKHGVREVCGRAGADPTAAGTPVGQKVRLNN